MPITNLASELPYAAALSADLIPTHCLSCFLPKHSDVDWRPCNHCGVVFYCNEYCQSHDVFDHQPECRAYRNWKVARRGVIDDYNAAYGDEKLRLLARLIRRRSRDGGIVDLTKDRPSCVKVRHLSDLLSHLPDLHSDAVRSVHLRDYVCDLFGFFTQTTEEMSELSTTDEAIEEMVGKMCINCFGIPVTTVDDEVHIGVAVYLTSSRFDHSCKPNLFMDFEGNRLTWRYYYENEENKIPDYDKLWVSYGCISTYAGYTAVPTRQQRQLSLATRYYFNCQCEWCLDDKDADLSETASTRLCNACKRPYLIQPDQSSAGFVLKQSCQCPEDGAMFHDCFEDDEAVGHLDKLLKEWCTTFSPLEQFESAMKTVSNLEPLRQLAHRYFHPTLNLRYVQINELLFHAYRAIALSDCSRTVTPTISIFPIPDPKDPSVQNMKRRALVGACLCGEMTVSAYQQRLEPYETVMARFCFQLAELYELNNNSKGAVKNYQRALDIWKYHGVRGVEQCGVIEACLKKVAQSCLLEGIRNLGVTETPAAVNNGNETGGKKTDQREKMKHKKRKKK